MNEWMSRWEISSGFHSFILSLFPTSYKTLWGRKADNPVWTLPHSAAWRHEPHLPLTWGFLSFKALSHLFIKFNPHNPGREAGLLASSDEAPKRHRDESHGPSLTALGPSQGAQECSTFPPPPCLSRLPTSQCVLLGDKVTGNTEWGADESKQPVTHTACRGETGLSNCRTRDSISVKDICLQDGLMFIRICIFWVSTTS